MMTPPDRLPETRRALASVCELMESPVISPGTLFYLAQLRETLLRELEHLEMENRRSAAA
jgi:hypothetical protein